MAEASEQEVRLREVARRYAEGQITAMDLRTAFIDDYRGISDGPLTGRWGDLFGALERWEDTLHVSPVRQTAIEAEIRTICVLLIEDDHEPNASPPDQPV